MRATVLGLLVVVGLTFAVVGTLFQRGPAMAQRPAVAFDERAIAEGRIIALSAATGDGSQQITLIDPRQRVMSVYHVNLQTGEISLRSVRNFRWDLLMDEFNGSSPTPREIKALVEQR